MRDYLTNIFQTFTPRTSTSYHESLLEQASKTKEEAWKAQEKAEKVQKAQEEAQKARATAAARFVILLPNSYVPDMYFGSEIRI